MSCNGKRNKKIKVLNPPFMDSADKSFRRQYLTLLKHKWAQLLRISKRCSCVKYQRETMVSVSIERLPIVGLGRYQAIQPNTNCMRQKKAFQITRKRSLQLIISVE